MAQSTTTGAIGGVVTNPNREVVSGAAVTVLNVETNKEDSGTTDDQGRFKVVNLRPGIYTVTINGSGFSPYTQEKVTVEVGREMSDKALAGSCSVLRAARCPRARSRRPRSRRPTTTWCRPTDRR